MVDTAFGGKSDGGPLQLGLQFTRGVDDEQRKSMVRQQFARGQEGLGLLKTGKGNAGVQWSKGGKRQLA